ncbi:MAG: SdrD B-like domain-containing protein, partial [Ignavibacteria bacterium]|nr:SdrD B-like domain-containing protein [Ignavibacteria bacterium]
MKKSTTAMVSMLLAILLLASFSYPAYAQKVTGVKKVMDHTSIARVSTYTDGVNITYKNPYTNNNQTTFAGAFDGTLNSAAKKFYCIDLTHNLSLNEDYWDEGTTPSKVTYVLNNYYPYKTGYAGALSDMKKEAAAVQVAIWHFMDNVDANTVTDATIKNRALTIIADAEANHSNVDPLQTLQIIPASQFLPVGSPATFIVKAISLLGTPISGLTITLTTTAGTLSAASATTGANGETGAITLNSSSVVVATVKAKASVEIPQGTKYVHKNLPDAKQKLVLATPASDEKEVTSDITFQTNNCDLSKFTTYTQGGWGSPSNSGPGKIRDANFTTVYPSGLTVGGTYTIKLTSAQAVEDYLPDGGTPAALTQNYINPTTAINVLAGQVVALQLNVDYSAAGFLGSTSYSIGTLNILSGPFSGMTVNQFLAIANSTLGGANTGYSFSDINEAATAINENFDNGTVNNGYLGCDAPKASLGDKVWLDVDKDGIQDSGENGIASVTVKLYTCANVLVATTTTNANGIYSFTNLTPGDYYVVFTAPSGMTVSPKDQGSNNATDSDADVTTGKTVCTTLIAGENDLTWDAGFYTECKNKIGDTVWH